MANSVIAALRVNLGLDSAQFDSGLKNASASASNFAKAAMVGFAAVAAAATAAFATVATTAKRADDAWKASQSLGIHIRDLGRLQHAADMSGVSFGSLQTAVRRASQGIGNALNGVSNESTKAFDRIGVALKNADGTARGMSDVLGDVAEQFSQMPNGAEKTALAVAMFGRSGAELIPMLNAGRQGLADMGDEAERLGLVFDETSGRLAERFNDNLSRMAKATEGLVNALGVMLLPAAVAITDAIVAMQAPASQMIEWLGGIAQYAGVAVAGLAGFFAPAMIAGLTQLSFLLGTTLVGAIRAVGIAMMANPIGLIVGALAAAVTAVFVFRDSLRDVIGVDLAQIVTDGANKIIGAFVGAYNFVVSTWENLPAAFSAIAKEAVNALVDELGKPLLTFGDNVILPGLPTGWAKQELTDEERKALDGATGSFGDAFSAKYLENMGGALAGLTSSAETANAAMSGLVGTLGATGTAAGSAATATQEQLQSALEAMRMSLMTEEQAELASHEKRLAQIAEFYNRGAILKAEHDAMMEGANAQHAERMAEITRRGVEEEVRLRGQMVGHVSSILGSLSTIFENFGEENLVAAKAFALAQAIINTAQGITAALTIPGPMGWAQAAAVGAAGAAQISTILSAQKGGSKRPTVGSGSSGVSSAAPAQAMRQVSAQIIVQGDSFGEAHIESLAKQFAELVNTGGATELVTSIRRAS